MSDKMIKAIKDRIVLIPEPIKEQINGIFIPETSLKKAMRGTVIDTGIDCTQIKVGHEVIFLEGHGVSIDGQLIIFEKDVLGYLEK
jgi:co-chaperonin GroES (HSP10)